MKKLAIYSILATLAVVAVGGMFIFGFFDLNLGQLNLIGATQHTFNPAEVHNSVVEKTQEIGLCSSKALKLFEELTPESTLKEIKTEINQISTKLKSLTKIILNNEFINADSETHTVFNNIYLPTTENWLNTYSKALAYFEEKGLTQENIDSFKGIAGISNKELIEAHNKLAETLNFN